MTDLFHPDYINEIDRSNMLGEIRSLPEQLEAAWDLGKQYQLPDVEDFKHIIISGMGGSAIGADIVASYALDQSQVPITVIRSYALPQFATGEKVLVICSSHSGNTEEVLSIFDQAFQRDCSILVISTGGKLMEKAQETDSVFWKFDHQGQPRAALGFSFGLLYCLFSRLGILSKGREELFEVTEELRGLCKKWDVESAPEENLAKRIAGQAVGRLPIYFGAEHLEPIARRWKTQTNELAKTIAGFEFMPEADHNSLAGLEFPIDLLPKYNAIFLNSDFYNERNKKRMRLTMADYMVSGICTDQIFLKSKTKLLDIWQNILLGDFVTYFLALAYQVDPTPIERLESFKNAMKNG